MRAAATPHIDRAFAPASPKRSHEPRLGSAAVVVVILLWKGMSMLSRSFAPLALSLLAACGLGGGPAFAGADQRVSGPHVHQNLAIYFIHGESASGAVPLTLDEA